MLFLVFAECRVSFGKIEEYKLNIYKPSLTIVNLTILTCAARNCAANLEFYGKGSQKA